jgi:hypothetical protein
MIETGRLQTQRVLERQKRADGGLLRQNKSPNHGPAQSFLKNTPSDAMHPQPPQILRRSRFVQ